MRWKSKEMDLRTHKRLTYTQEAGQGARTKNTHDGHQN